MTLRGKCSWFGGPEDKGVSPSEGLAFISSIEQAPHLFLPSQPSGTTGLARRLDPDVFYVACRWDYDETPKAMLPDMVVRVRAPRTGREYMATPADWGPHQDTGRVADLSPGLMAALGIQTDDEVEVIYSDQEEESEMTYKSIVVSSGHGKYVRGASGILDEVDEARKVTERLAEELRKRGVEVKAFHDDTSHSQNENLNTIVNYHNKQSRDLDVSVHFNAYEQTSKPMGVEVLYVTQSALAGQVSGAIAECGFIDRGAKKRTDLFFLNKTNKPAILIETCFVDSEADADLYGDKFADICDAIANELGGRDDDEDDRPPAERPPGRPPPAARIDIAVSGDVLITINGVPVTS